MNKVIKTLTSAALLYSTKRLVLFTALTVVFSFLESRIEAAQQNFPVTVNSSGILTSPTNYLNLGMQHYKAFNFPNVRNKITTNGSVNIFALGDSMVEGRLWLPITRYFIDTLGYQGSKTVGQQVGGYPFTPNYTLGGTSYRTNDDFSRWFSYYYVLPNAGDSVTISETTGPRTPNLYGNFIEIDYIAESGGGSFKFQTNLNSAGWVDMTGTISTDNLGAKAGVALKFTNSFQALLQLRVVNISGTVRLISASLVNKMQSGGCIAGGVSIGGRALFQAMQSSNILGPILRAWEPDLLVLKWADNDYGNTLFTSGLMQFNDLVSTYLTNTDILFISCNEVNLGLDSQNADLKIQNIITYTNCLARNYAFFHESGEYGSFSNGLKYGFFNGVGIDPHPTAVGDYFSSSIMFNWADFFSRKNKKLGTIYFVTPSYTDFDRTNAAIRIEDQLGNVGAGYNVYGALPSPGSPYSIQAPLIVGYNHAIYAPGVGGYGLSIGGGGGIIIDYNTAGVNNGLQIQYGQIIVGHTDGVLFSGNVGFEGGFITNANGLIWYSTNNTPTLAHANGSFATVTDGSMYIRSNSAWYPVNTGRKMSTMFTNLVQIGNGAGTLTTLFTNNIPLNTITNLCDTLRVTASGDYAASANIDKTIVLWIGNSIIFSNRQAINSGSFTLDAEIMRATTTTNYQCSVSFHTSSTAIQAAGETNVSAFVTNSLTPMGIWMTGNGTGASDVVGKSWRVEWKPAP